MKRHLAVLVAIVLRSSLLCVLPERDVCKLAVAQLPGGGGGGEGFVVLPEDFLDDPNVPHDAAAGASASLAELGQFAWREFIALSWPVQYPTEQDPRRGMYDASKHFADTVLPVDPANPRALVWETFFHKAEMFPGQEIQGQPAEIPPASFDSFPPVYRYLDSPLAPPIEPADPTDPKRTRWHNLDETNEISRCTLYAHSTADDDEVGDGINEEFQILYEAKVNRVYYDYIVANKLWDFKARENVVRTTGNAAMLDQYDLLRYGSGCGDVPDERVPGNPHMIVVRFPCGSIDSDREGAIELKPGWRKLTDEEAASGRYYTNTVQYYDSEEGSPKSLAQNATYGLVALHIIQKTKSFPSFCYATFEQVDNASSGLRYINWLSKDGGEYPVERKHGIPSAINAVNVAVHRLIKAKNPNSVWQYYQLIGVQANATDPPGPDASQDEISTFNLANLVVETNEELQSFSGRLGPERNENLPSVNTFRLGTAFNAGGCLGCHGFQGQFPGYDFSVIAAKGAVSSPEPRGLNAEQREALSNFLLNDLGKK